jgi:hypothetical protein
MVREGDVQPVILDYCAAMRKLVDLQNTILPPGTAWCAW